MFGSRAEIAGILWRAMRAEYAGEREIATLGRLRKLLTAEGPAADSVAEFCRLVARAEKQVPDANNNSRVGVMLAIASFFQDRGSRDLALLYADKAVAETPPETAFSMLPCAPNLEKIGDLFAKENRWEQAVRAYEEATKHDCPDAAALYLLGDANLHLGKEAEGRKQMQTALLLPLGDADRRYSLIETLQRLGRQDEALRQCNLLVRTYSATDNWVVVRIRAEQAMAHIDIAKGDRLAAAAAGERFPKTSCSRLSACSKSHITFACLFWFMRPTDAGC